jgi:transcriptional regulator with XRE-family HTH domain
VATAAQNTEQTRHPDVELDDIEAYVSTFNDEQKSELAAAEAAIDVAILLNRARRRRGLSQAAAAKLAGLKQQAVSRFESPDANPRLETIQAYLGALGYALELKAIDIETGDEVGPVVPARSRWASSRKQRMGEERASDAHAESASRQQSSARTV